MDLLLKQGTGMPHSFIGRKRELQLLSELFEKKSASLVVIRGRRRIGKSRLVQEFAKTTPHYVFSGLPLTNKITAADQREEFARQIQREIKIQLPHADDWGDLFWHLSQQAQRGKIVLVLDEISWMGSKDPTFLGKLKIAWDLYFKNNPQLVLILCGSISSWIEENILSSTAFMGRISLDIILEELSLAECNEFWNAEQDIVSAFDKFKILSMTGGVPRYLEELLPNQSAETNIQKMCFHADGILLSEFERIFSDLFLTRNTIYKDIVERLAEGACELEDIYTALGVQKSGVVSGYMDDLVSVGLVSQDSTWHLKTGLDSKLSHYRLKDNYLRFYLKCICPNKNMIEKKDLRLLFELQSVMGLQFENLVLSNRKTVQQILGIEPSEIVNDNPFFQSKTKNRPGCQIDYMIQTRFGTCYLCEIKFSNEKIKNNIINEIKTKIKNLSLPKNMSIKPVLIHVNGVDSEIEKSGFFSKIISFNDFFQKHEEDMRDGRIELKKVLQIVPHIENDFIRVIETYSTPIVSPNFDEPLKTNHGCGTFAVIANHYGILTAAHVANIFIRRKDNLIYIPFQDELHPITYNKIVLLPDIEGVTSIDLAFIVLNKEQQILDFGKLFLSLDQECPIVEEGKFLEMQCGYYAAPGQEKYVNYSNTKPILNYEYSGVYLGNPEKDSYSKRSFYFPIFYPQHLQDKKIPFDQFFVSFEKWKGIPNSYSGTSGSGFWGAEQMIDDDNQLRLVNPKLIGVMVEENRVSRKLGVRGPVSLYKIFLKFCVTALLTGSVDQALNEIFISE
jgi:uncharacterized protein